MTISIYNTGPYLAHFDWGRSSIVQLETKPFGRERGGGRGSGRKGKGKSTVYFFSTFLFASSIYKSSLR